VFHICEFFSYLEDSEVDRGNEKFWKGKDSNSKLRKLVGIINNLFGSLIALCNSSVNAGVKGHGLSGRHLWLFGAMIFILFLTIQAIQG